MAKRDNRKSNWYNKLTDIVLISTLILLLLCSIAFSSAVIFIVNKDIPLIDDSKSSSPALEDKAIIPTFDISDISEARPKLAPEATPTLAPEPTAGPTPLPSPTLTQEPTIIPIPTPITTAITPIPTPTPDPSSSPEPSTVPTPTPKPKRKMPKLLSNPKGERDAEGRLLQFKDLLEANNHVKGWIKDSTMDYVVLQPSKSNPEYYLFKDFFGDYYKAGSLFLDHRSSVETPSQNLVIHGHNMISTPEKMFHYIKFYKDVSYYKKHPIISFDTLYEEADYKVYAIIKTTPKANKDYFFEYRQSSFKDSSDFLNFVYQTRIRSLIIVDDVDINENDTLLTLSTCSYEVDNNYRTVVFARKIREGESSKVDMKTVKVNKSPLYCDDWYKQNGGKAPKLPATFEKALEKGIIKWYNPPK